MKPSIHEQTYRSKLQVIESIQANYYQWIIVSLSFLTLNIITFVSISYLQGSIMAILSLLMLTCASIFMILEYQYGMNHIDLISEYRLLQIKIQFIFIFLLICLYIWTIVTMFIQGPSHVII